MKIIRSREVERQRGLEGRKTGWGGDQRVALGPSHAILRILYFEIEKACKGGWYNTDKHTDTQIHSISVHPYARIMCIYRER